jgi:hypothetical protein
MTPSLDEMKRNAERNYDAAIKLLKFCEENEVSYQAVCIFMGSLIAAEVFPYDIENLMKVIDDWTKEVSGYAIVLLTGALESKKSKLTDILEVLKKRALELLELEALEERSTV